MANKKEPVEYLASFWSDEWGNAFEPTIATLATANDESDRYFNADDRLQQLTAREFANGELAEELCQYLQIEMPRLRFAVLEESPYGGKRVLATTQGFRPLSDDDECEVDGLIDHFFTKERRKTLGKAEQKTPAPNAIRYLVRSADERKASKAAISKSRKATKSRQSAKSSSSGCSPGVLVALVAVALLAYFIL